MLKEKSAVIHDQAAFHESTIFGPLVLKEPVLIELINSRAMQRLKLINQYGVACYFKKNIHYSRYDHSLGVLHILMMIGASMQEQIAGLLHDVSHTVFSHVADVLFSHHSAVSSYQDDIHEWYILKTDIPAILHKHGLSVKDILHKSGSFMALEQNLPNICADRLEYLLHGALLENKITSSQVKELFGSMQFDNGSWYFISQEHARTLADLSLYLTEYHFAAPWNIACYYWAAQILRYALEQEVLHLDDIHFSSDDIVWHKLCTMKQMHIKSLIEKIEHPEMFCHLTNMTRFTIHAKPKFRGIDPLIGDAKKGLAPLSIIDRDFNKRFTDLKQRLAQGIYLQLT